MSILLYAITRDDARAPAVTQLHEICAASLRALTEPVEEPLTGDLDELIQYEETVEAVMRDHTILPMRFGSVVGDEHEVRDLLTARAHEFRTALAQLDGAVEFGVHASIDSGAARAEAPVAGGSGVSYMRARLDEQRRQHELQAWLDAELEAVVRTGVYRNTPVCGPHSISAAYLVDRVGETAFLERVGELADTDGYSLSWSGPWPPYTFVRGLEQ
jgi:hypothetical protein